MPTTKEVKHVIAGTTASQLETISTQKKQMESHLLQVVAGISHRQPFVPIIRLQQLKLQCYLELSLLDLITVIIKSLLSISLAWV